MLRLVGWKTRNLSKRVENYWKSIRMNRPLTNYEKYQKEFNFIEIEYGERPSNNGLDICNPSFVFSTKLAKYLKYA